MRQFYIKINDDSAIYACKFCDAYTIEFYNFSAKESYIPF